MKSISTDMRFPSAETPTQKKLYEELDLWGIEFTKSMGFESLLQKMMLRRVSGRYLSVILGHCNLLLDLVRSSDEVESKHNDHVLMLNISIQNGNLPG